MTESLLLSIAAGSVAIALSFALVRMLVSLNRGGIPRFEQAGVDARVLSFAILLSVVAGALAGIVPALLASRANVRLLLKSGGRSLLGGFVKTRSVLIVIQVALSIVLLATSGLLIRSYLKFVNVDPGFSPATLTFKIDLTSAIKRRSSPPAFTRTFSKSLKPRPASCMPENPTVFRSPVGNP